MTARDAGAGRPGTTLMVRCECGFEVRGSADEIVSGMSKHALESHNMQVTREQVLERARPA